MNHPLTTQMLAKIHQAELLEEAQVNRWLRETQTTRSSRLGQWLTTVLFMVAGAGGLFLLAG
jgi:hypothetical protein